MYSLDNKEYFSNSRIDLLELIPKKNRNGKILEIGAGAGDTLIYAKENGYAKEVHGVELFELENSNQLSTLIDGFFIANIEDCNLEYADKTFDVIILGDVLEHLVDPYKVIEYLKKILKDDGVLISSIPNIRYFKVLKSILIDGDFRYAESGILDRTHLRFFCRKNIMELFEDKGFNIDKMTSDFEKKSRKKGKKDFLNTLLFGRLTDFFVLQHLTVASKKLDV